MAGPNLFSNLGADSTLNVKPGPGRVYSLSCDSESVSDHYIQLHDTATVPAASAVPKFSFRVPVGAQIIVGTDFFTEFGLDFTLGIAFAYSQTKDTYTAGSASAHSTHITWS